MSFMVRAGGSAPMMVVGVKHGVADCLIIDGNGRVQKRSHNVSQLTPLWLSLSPRSTWPETSQIDLIEIEREEQEAAVARKNAARAKRATARKARKSKKLKGRNHAV